VAFWQAISDLESGAVIAYFETRTIGFSLNSYDYLAGA